MIAKRKAKFGEVEKTEKVPKKQKASKKVEAASGSVPAAAAPVAKKEKGNVHQILRNLNTQN